MNLGGMYFNGGDLPTMLIYFAIAFIISTIFCIFSPFGIGFIIFSIVRGKTESEVLRKTSLVFQIILTVITFLLGSIISIFLLLQNHFYNGRFSMPSLYETSPVLGIFFGVTFVVIIEMVFLFWMSSWINKKESENVNMKRR